MVLFARPCGADWLSNAVRVDSALENLSRLARIPQSQKPNRRGSYVTLPAGCGFGGGRTCPGSYANTAHNAPLVQAILDRPDVQRVARYVDAGLQAYFPKLHSFYSSLLEHILADSPEIVRMFQGCCYGACHLNLHNASTVDHEDWYNILFGMCAVYSSGLYDHTRSGHFIAWSLGIVAQFPPACAVYVPSACVTHANTPIASHETRSSIAFFMSAGLARWYHNGYISDKEFKERASVAQLNAWNASRAKLWEVGLELLQYT
ncbi:hypothetical protein BT96DRAFT_818081 [Gymnopus androsaceus JB14]|uniref:Uncharacterized protein n=1 Tax=Gymnopus androsaceus JB14 TaxID=1447944 RepID=A0A6A4HTQ0_9AGAR|nr:hypothetical protein BT96DRAFT_818081 [Gymnopus androsaceus JB14]